MDIEFIKLDIESLIEEGITCNGFRFSHPAFTRKLPKGLSPCDYDITEKKIEIEYSTGERYWFNLSTFFGKVIAEVKDIFLFYRNTDVTEKLNIVGFEVFKIKLKF